MNYATGLMLGAAIGKNIRGVFAHDTGAAQGARGSASPFALVSQTSGRRRYRVQHISAELAQALETKIATLDYIDAVSVNSNTGSILITHAPQNARRVDALVAALKERVFRISGAGVINIGTVGTGVGINTASDINIGTVGAGKTTRRPWGAKGGVYTDESQLPQAHSVMGSIVTHAIHDFLKGISEWIRKKTNNWLDFTSLAFLALIITGIRRISLEGGRLSGFQLFWWGITLLRGRIYRDM